MHDYTTLTLRLPSDTAAAIETIAAARNTTAEDVIARAAITFLQKKVPQLLPGYVPPESMDEDLLTEALGKAEAECLLAAQVRDKLKAALRNKSRGIKHTAGEAEELRLKLRMQRLALQEQNAARQAEKLRMRQHDKAMAAARKQAEQMIRERNRPVIDGLIARRKAAGDYPTAAEVQKMYRSPIPAAAIERIAARLVANPMQDPFVETPQQDTATEA